MNRIQAASYRLQATGCIIFLFVLCGDCFAQPVSSVELINSAKEYDGKEVVYQGEVIGDIMRRKSFVWANVNDGKNAVGIWIKADLVKDITYTGSYKSQGDRVEVAGVFHRACIEHGGDADIHATALRLVCPGSPIQEKLVPEKKELAMVLLGILGLTWILTLLKRK